MTTFADEIEKVREAARVEEREACARIADAVESSFLSIRKDDGGQAAASLIAQRIRERGTSNSV